MSGVALSKVHPKAREALNRYSKALIAFQESKKWPNHISTFEENTAYDVVVQEYWDAKRELIKFLPRIRT